ncbi:MAG: fibrobacter succinogenes major paralogous domain-containing protein [Prevotellaceae bacterium]|jgi:uncharacterized protein (TIGR02145 family)|nr:fibrobacter succinogenes major paralogous domain-containing protein [Prevotellaceae bacterium]
MKKIILIIALATAAINLFSQEERMYIMKDGVLIYQKAVSDIDSILFHNPGIGEASPTTDPGVVINGVRWATRNVDAFGTFADTPESYGKFYQWNRNRAWSATDPAAGVAVSDWDATTPEGAEWTEANDPSPVGWRIPTTEEQRTLLDTEKVTNEWTTQNGVNGRKFTDITSGLSVFFPAAGLRDYSNGTLGSNAGNYGRYWSSTQRNSDYANTLYFANNFADLGGNLYRSSGLPVRVVVAE